MPDEPLVPGDDPESGEPPRLQSNQYAAPSGGPSDAAVAGMPNEASVNPFAPVSAGSAGSSVVARTNLDSSFWVVFFLAVLLFGGLTVVLPFIGGVGLAALVAAVVRVPLLQTHKARVRPGVELAGPVALLATSWVFMLACGFAACVAFCVVCFPSTVLALNIDQGESVLWPIVFGVSGLVGLVAFGFLFRLSLRLPV